MRSSPHVAMGALGSSTILSIEPGVAQLSAVYCLATLSAASSAFAFAQPMPTRPLLAWALTAAWVSAAVGAGWVSAGAGVVALGAGVVAVPVAVPVAGVVAARRASGTMPFWAVAVVDGVA